MARRTNIPFHRTVAADPSAAVCSGATDPPARVHTGRFRGRPQASALLRYISAMATIQIREVPEASYEVLRRRARQAGQSMQAYLRAEIVAIAARSTKREAIETIEAILGGSGGSDPTASSVLDDLAADRR